MLQISDTMMQGYVEAAMDDVARTIDDWLPEFLPDWPGIARHDRLAMLTDICRTAEGVGMELETDLALFAWIVLAGGPDWRGFCDRPDVVRLLRAPDWNVASRLTALQDLAMPEGAR